MNQLKVLKQKQTAVYILKTGVVKKRKNKIHGVISLCLLDVQHSLYMRENIRKKDEKKQQQCFQVCCIHWFCFSRMFNLYYTSIQSSQLSPAPITISVSMMIGKGIYLISQCLWCILFSIHNSVGLTLAKLRNFLISNVTGLVTLKDWNTKSCCLYYLSCQLEIKGS